MEKNYSSKILDLLTRQIQLNKELDKFRTQNAKDFTSEVSSSLNEVFEKGMETAKFYSIAKLVVEKGNETEPEKIADEAIKFVEDLMFS